jgi:DNA-binding SARP family transcriptional activator
LRGCNLDLRELAYVVPTTKGSRMRVKVLGPVEAEEDGAAVAVGGPQQRRLLALLVVHRGRAVSTDRLVDALWPDGDAPDGAARSMRTYLSRLRAVLPAGSITTN